MSKFKKLVKRLLLAVMGVVIVLILTLYFVLQYRIKLVLKEVVAMETNGAYTLDFSDHKFSLLNAHIKLKNAHLKCVHPVEGEMNYDVKIPSFYISIDSWRTLLWDRKLVVDSLYAGSPEIKITGASKMFSGNKMSLQLNDAYQALKNIASQLEVQSLVVKNASLGLHTSDSIKPFTINHVDVGIHNFAWRTKESRHFLLSDDIDIRIRDQEWVLAEGDSLRFAKLHFSAKKQRFTIDSCSLVTTNVEKGRVINVRADRFFINSSNLTAAYLKNKLIIDTLTCINPVVQVESKSNKTKDTANITGVVRHVFEGVNFKYISIIDGQLMLSQKLNGSTVSYASRKSNIRLYDLDINTGTPSTFSLRDLKFDLDTVRFYTPDSLYVLRVGNFSIHNSDLVCSNATFLPVSPTEGNMKLFFPQIVLSDISLPDLWQKKLKAEKAVFESPEIIITQPTGKKKIIPRKAKSNNDFYAILHDFSSVVDVEDMQVNEGRLQLIPNSPSGMTMSVSGINSLIELNKLFQSGSVLDIRKTFSSAAFKNLQFRSPKMIIVAEGILAHGAIGENYVSNASIKLSNGLDLKVRGAYWIGFDWNLLYNHQKLFIDQLRFHYVDVRYNPVQSKAADNVSDLIPIAINRFSVGRVKAQLNFLNGISLATHGSSIEVAGLSNNEKGLQWQDIKAVFQKASFTKTGLTVTVDTAVLDKQDGTYLRNTAISYQTGRLDLPAVKLSTTIMDTKLSNLHLEYLTLDDPRIFVNQEGKQQGKEQVAGIKPPFNLTTDKLRINRAKLEYRFPDSSNLKCTTSMVIDSVRMLKDAAEILRYRSCDMSIADAKWENRKIAADIGAFGMVLPSATLQRTGKDLRFETDVFLRWANAGLRYKDSSRFQLNASGLSGELSPVHISLSTERKWKWIDVVEKLKLASGSLFYSNAASTVMAGKISSDISSGKIEIDSVSMTPKMSRTAFFEQSQWQKDYQQFSCAKLLFSNADILRFIRDTAVDVGSVVVQDAVLITSRDKNMPFEHGVEKLMPTKLIESIGIPFSIHSVLIKNAAVTSNEIASVTQREGSIPFLFLNGEIRNFNSRPKQGDSLSVAANATLLDHYIRSFRYRESYSDSLSGFHLSARMSPMNLTVFSQISNPLVAMEIKRGNADTLYTRIAGNKYGSFGEIKFYYRKLKVRFLNPVDTTKKNLGLSFKNFVTNEFVLKNNNKAPARVFYIRDAEKFIFNYWFKAIFSGVIASAGVKNDKKYIRQYNKLKEIYSLPDKE